MKEVLKILDISRSTFNRILKSGKIQCTRTGLTGHFDQKITFTPEQIGKSEAQCTARLNGGSLGTVATPPASGGELPPHPAPLDNFSKPAPGANFAPRSPLEERIEAVRISDLEFAEEYKAGRVPDSLGNYYNSTDKISLLGPIEPTPKKKFSCDAHMPEGLRVKIGISGNDNPLNSDEYRRPNQPKERDTRSPQEKKQCLDRATILAAMRHGISR
jgi:hypothetical protein